MSNLQLPTVIRGIDVYKNNIPTSCSLRTMLQKLINASGGTSDFKAWEINCFNSYNLEPIKSKLLKCGNDLEMVEIIKEHILDGFPVNFGRNVVTIYLVAYITETYGSGKSVFMDHLLKNVANEGSRNIIRSVGLGHGRFLAVLNDDGSIKDFEFFEKLVNKRRVS